MGVSVHWYALAVATSLLNGFSLGLIGWREQDTALRNWSTAWLSWGLAAMSLSLLGSPEAHPLMAISCGFLWVISSLYFLRGAYLLIARPMPRFWYGVAFVTGLGALLLGVGPSGPAGMMPLVIFQSVGVISTGVLVVRESPTRTGARLCGAALIVLGLHVLDAPLLAKSENAFLWGFALALALQVLTALGMLVLYYENARARLLSAERELEATRRIEALGRVAGGVAHDFNNMLTVMQGNVELLRRSDGESPERNQSLQTIEATIERAARLTSQLLAFGRRSVVKSKAVDVREIVEQTLSMLKQVLPENIQLRFDCDDAEWHAALDQALLEQIVLNLVTNARDAISGNGNISVRLEKSLAPAPELVLCVTDDGTGMDEAVLSQAFEPFFTSKGPGSGTGLGLASVKGATSQLGGKLEVRSRKGEGTTFEIRLPYVRADLLSQYPEESRVRTSLRILVVDDDPEVRRTTLRTLNQRGHHAEQAADGHAATKMLEESTFDLIISDVLMPHSGGLDLLKQVETSYPDTRLILTSGYPRDAEIDQTRVDFLPKPYKGPDLIQLVESHKESSQKNRAAG